MIRTIWSPANPARFRAFAGTSLAIAKRDLAPEVLDAETRLRGFGRRIGDGEVAPNLRWTGRLERFLPSHQRVGGWVLGLAGVFAGARARLQGNATEGEELAYPDLIRRQMDAVPVSHGSANTGLRPLENEGPTLLAIRSAIGPAAQDAALDRHGVKVRAMPVLAPVDETTGPGGLVGLLKQSLWSALCWAWLGVMLGFAIPGGAIKALLYHLDGGDLAGWS